MTNYYVYDEAKWYISELTSRVVAESGIPSDRYHLGKIIFQCLKDYPDKILQIDGATGESETKKSALERSIKCAECFRNYGLEVGDIVVLMAPSHLSMCVPIYAGAFRGIVVAPIDKTLGIQELQSTLNVIKPKIIFCQYEKACDVQVALNLIQLNSQIITFDKGDDYFSFSEFNQRYGGETPIEDFKITNFDPENTTLCFTATSGTTGSSKFAKFVHKNFVIAIPINWSNYRNFPNSVEMTMITFPPNWMTGYSILLATAMLNITRLQSSKPMTQKHTYDLIKTYRPTDSCLTPTFLRMLVKQGGPDNVCDFTSFKSLALCGSPSRRELIEYIKGIAPKTAIFNLYGMTETAGSCLYSNQASPDYCGQPTGTFQYRLVDINTLEDICEPNVSGELWLKGPSIFKGYLNSNSEVNKEAFTHDGWFKTGDVLYRDDSWNFFFVDRIKLMLKYKDNKISPVEIENVIKKHSGVQDVVVTSVQDQLCEDLLVACVVRKEDSDVSADDIKNIVKDNLCDFKQLRGGVIFVDRFPTLPSTKVNRMKVKTMAKALICN